MKYKAYRSNVWNDRKGQFWRFYRSNSKIVCIVDNMKNAGWTKIDEESGLSIWDKYNEDIITGMGR